MTQIVGPLTLISTINLASTLKAQGELAGARELQEAAVASALRVLGEDHPNTKTYATNFEAMSKS